VRPRHRLGGRVDRLDRTVDTVDHHAAQHRVGDGPPPLVEAQRVGERAPVVVREHPGLQHLLHLAPQDAQRLDVRRCRASRLVAEHAQRADGRPVAHLERHAHVRADERIAHHERVVGEPVIEARVLDHHHVVTGDGVGAERHLPRRRPHVPAVTGLEPLPVAVDERDQRDGEVADRRRKRDDVVERGLRGGVEDAEVDETSESLGFVGRDRGHRTGSIGGRCGHDTSARCVRTVRGSPPAGRMSWGER
jgi:hypothetical protein